MKPYFECAHGVIYHGDCLDIMPRLGVKVDAIITDPPYGTTSCAWDTVIPFADMWAAIDTVRKENAAVCLFGAEPFSSFLRISNIKQYRYDWIWEKEAGTGFLDAKKKPLKITENISVFYEKQCLYNPQMRDGFTPYRYKQGDKKTENYGKQTCAFTKSNGERYPINFIRDKEKLHPTQKPQALLAYLIKTYTNEGELVLDFTYGSGTTAVAAINTNRRFIGIELEEKYCEIAAKRIEHAMYGNSLLNL